MLTEALPKPANAPPGSTAIRCIPHAFVVRRRLCAQPDAMRHFDRGHRVYHATWRTARNARLHGDTGWPF
jgi:hypothetical protein